MIYKNYILTLLGFKSKKERKEEKVCEFWHSKYLLKPSFCLCFHSECVYKSYASVSGSMKFVFSL